MSTPKASRDDEIEGVAVLLLMAGQIVSASAELLSGDRPYAGSALLRQVVEIEYLMWAFNHRHGDATTWLNSDKQEGMNFFTPRKLREAANSNGEKFRSEDYGYHCELGGHPTPTGITLLIDDEFSHQLLLSDLVNHAGEIWQNFIHWCEQHKPVKILELYFGGAIPEFPGKLKKLHSLDPFNLLSPPP